MPLELSQLKSSLDYFKRRTFALAEVVNPRRNWPCLNVRCGRLPEVFPANSHIKGEPFVLRLCLAIGETFAAAGMAKSVIAQKSAVCNEACE